MQRHVEALRKQHVQLLQDGLAAVAVAFPMATTLVESEAEKLQRDGTRDSARVESEAQAVGRG